MNIIVSTRGLLSFIKGCNRYTKLSFSIEEFGCMSIFFKSRRET